MSRSCIVFCLLILTCGNLTFSLDTKSSGTPITGFNVSIAGEPIGVVANRDLFYSYLRFVSDENRWFAVDDSMTGLIHFEPGVVMENIFVLQSILKENLRNYLDTRQKGWIIKTDGRPVGALSTEQEAREVVEQIKEHYLPDIEQGERLSEIFISIPQAIDISPHPVQRDSLLNTDDAVLYLLNGTTELKAYTVKKDDTVWDIRRKYNLTLEEFVLANPGLNPERIYPGDELNLIVPKPFITVRTRFRKTYNVPIPYQTLVRTDPSLYRTETVVIRPGKPGEKRIIREFVLQDAVTEVNRVVGEEVLEKPVARILNQGSRRTPDDELSSAVLPPGIGIITSTFGIRWGRMHTGIDIGIPVGTPVFAYQSGRVFLVSLHPKLGNVIILEHSDDLKTVYGHMSEIFPKEGDKVGSKEQIGLSGNSGYSTGPHLHFEVHKGNRLWDPLTFLRTEGVKTSARR